MSLAETIRSDLKAAYKLGTKDKKEAICYTLFVPIILPLIPILSPPLAMLYYLLFRDDEKSY